MTVSTSPRSFSRRRTFASFAASPIVSRSSNKGLALFPRLIGGRFAALSRSDHETNTVVFSDNLHLWEDALPYQVPTRTWEVLQLGNCGSPIETDAGWLVLTHGVGPMRTYSIGADTSRPRRPDPDHRPAPRTTSQPGSGRAGRLCAECRLLLRLPRARRHLILPYGIGDSAVGVATMSLPLLLGDLVAS